LLICLCDIYLQSSNIILIRLYIFSDYMRVTYNLKLSQPTNFVEPLLKHLQENYDIQTAYSFKNILGKINELRNKATSISMRTDTTHE
jgi:hypothetical protein